MGSFQKSPFSRDSSSRELRDCRDSRELPDCGKQRRIRPFPTSSRELRDFRDSKDASGEKTPFLVPKKVVGDPYLELIQSSFCVSWSSETV